jgi:hypothetical protein
MRHMPWWRVRPVVAEGSPPTRSPACPAVGYGGRPDAVNGGLSMSLPSQSVLCVTPQMWVKVAERITPMLSSAAANTTARFGIHPRVRAIGARSRRPGFR